MRQMDMGDDYWCVCCVCARLRAHVLVSAFLFSCTCSPKQQNSLEYRSQPSSKLVVVWALRDGRTGICVCLCVCVRACARVRVRVRVGLCVHATVCSMRVQQYASMHRRQHAHAAGWILMDAAAVADTPRALVGVLFALVDVPAHRYITVLQTLLPTLATSTSGGLWPRGCNARSSESSEAQEIRYSRGRGRGGSTWCWRR